MDELSNLFLKNSAHRRSADRAADPEMGLAEMLSEIDPSIEMIMLPKPETLGYQEKGLREGIEKRRTLRRLDPEDGITLEELSIALWLTQGIVKVDDKRQDTLRNLPSAGRRHPFETYLGIRNVPGLAPGIYHYIAQEHALQPSIPGLEAVDAIAEASFKQKHMQDAPVIFIWAAHSTRTTSRYGARGLRYIFIDAGHVCQNLYLAAELFDGAVCAIGAYDDDAANTVLGLDGNERFVAYMASLGRKRLSKE